MPDLWCDVDAALSEVPVNILPLIDDGDFKTIEGAVAYDAAGMALFWHFVTPAGAYTLTAVTPTTGGNYDWTDQGAAGIYTIEIPASGGASINNDTEGSGWFTGVATGVLPWRGPTIGFRAAGLNDLLIESAFSATRGLAGTALPAVAAEGAGGVFTRGSGAGQINQQANGQIDTNVARWLNTAASAPNTAGIPVVDVVRVANTVQTAGDIIGDTNDIQARLPAALTGDGNIKADTLRVGGTLQTAGDLAAMLTTIDDFLDTEIAAILAAVDTEVAAIKAKTDPMTYTVANVLDANIQRVNDVALIGDGAATPWGP